MHTHTRPLQNPEFPTKQKQLAATSTPHGKKKSLTRDREARNLVVTRSGKAKKRCSRESASARAEAIIAGAATRPFDTLSARLGRAWEGTSSTYPTHTLAKLQLARAYWYVMFARSGAERAIRRDWFTARARPEGAWLFARFRGSVWIFHGRACVRASGKVCTRLECFFFIVGGNFFHKNIGKLCQV